MFARGPFPGASYKAEPLKLLPRGTRCYRHARSGITGFAVDMPDGRQVGAGGTPGVAWRNALDWASRNLPKARPSGR
jgi:hypothetical protein